MNSAFFRFPHTPHIAWAGNEAPRDDKVLTGEEVAALLAGDVIVEEKLDGANLGFSVGSNGRLQAQNRGQYLLEPYAGQFRRLTAWATVHGAELEDALGGDLVAFGEWCAARHSLDYPALPDWWLLFDVYDRRVGRFWSTVRRNALAVALRLQVVPQIAEGKQTLTSLEGLIAHKSFYRNGPMEGVVVRRESGDWLLTRAKLVRQDFTQAIEGHWSRRRVEWNRVVEPLSVR